ncbi:MAG: HPr kinase/phosphorylase [Brevirhabdus sp.]
MRRDREQFHATAVAVDGQGVLILGASGAGKSTLALELITAGRGKLVSDDIVIVERHDGVSCVVAPPTSLGRLEARGVGILTLPQVSWAPLAMCIDLDKVETDRLPPSRTISMLGNPITLVHYSEQTHFPSAVLAYLRWGRNA